MRAMLFVLAAGAALFFVGHSANATTANGAVIGKAAQTVDQTIVVREGCGRGRHWSRWRNRCVWN